MGPPQAEAAKLAKLHGQAEELLEEAYAAQEADLNHHPVICMQRPASPRVASLIDRALSLRRQLDAAPEPDDAHAAQDAAEEVARIKEARRSRQDQDAAQKIKEARRALGYVAPRVRVAIVGLVFS